MSKYNKIVLGFYLVALLIAILSGFRFGFTGTHTPPVPFLIELLTISIGLVWLLIDTIVVSLKRKQTWRDIAGHVVGLVLSAFFVVYLATPFSWIMSILGGMWARI